MILRPMRPRYFIDTTIAADEVLRCVGDALRDHEAVVAQFAGHHFELMIQECECH